MLALSAQLDLEVVNGYWDDTVRVRMKHCP
jgi:hypothetical protein